MDTGQGPPDQTMRNRRKSPRVRARGLAVHVSANGRRHPCVVENISVGGLFIRTDSLLDLGAEVQVDLVRPGWKKMLQLGARIVSRTDAGGRDARQPPGMGVQFFGVRGEQRDKLDVLLQELGLPPEAGQPIPVSRPLDQAGLLDPLDPNPPLRGLPSLEPIDPHPPLDGQDPLDGEPLDPPLPPPRALPHLARDTRRPEPLDPHVPPTLYPVQPIDPLDPDLPASVAEELPLEAILGDERPPDEIVAPAAPPQPSDAARLMLQIQGLLLELSDAHDRLRQRDQEVEALREEVSRLKGTAQPG